MGKLLEEIHPGEILLEEFMKPLSLTARQLSADIDVPPSRISEIVNGHRPITADTAVRLGIFFSMDPEFWFAREGFPDGEIGQLLELMHTIDHNDLRGLLDPIKQAQAKR